MNKSLFIAFLAVLTCSVSTLAQGPFQRRGKRVAGGEDSSRQVKDVEGLIWEFKVMDNKERDRSQKTKMTGRMRIKQTSVFAVGQIEMQDPASVEGTRDAEQLLKDFDQNNDQMLDLKELDRLLVSVRGEKDNSTPNKKDRPKGNTGGAPGSVQGDLKGLLSQRINKAKEEDTGGERIGDLTKSASSEKRFKFDEDDKYPLSGIVVVRPDTTNRNGVWYGYYDEFSVGKKQKRWRFEMRKIEE